MINVSLLPGDMGVHGRIILKCMETGPINVDWVHLSWNRRQRWAPVNTVMKLRVS
jgi:hypothetical protein